jgi:hypothetical protein
VFTVPEGAKCWVKREGEDAWRRYRTTRASTFNNYYPDSGGAYWIFQAGDWYLRVAPSLVLGRIPKQTKKIQRSKPYSDRGRGVSRRRAQRSLRAARNR